MPTQPQTLRWLAAGDGFPDASEAWDENSPAPGLLAAGGALNVETLSRAYSSGIFPWYSEGQPTLWWSPSPRMVLNVADFRLHPSLRKSLQKFRRTAGCEVRINTAFEQVITACSTSPREGQSGTWILPEMVAAYKEMNAAGLAHSVETWVDGKLAGGLYCVAIGKSVFGESMFSRSTDASKIALAGLVGFCRHHGIQQIDCQQNTRHLASLGAKEISRNVFIKQVEAGLAEPGPVWQFEPLYWSEILPNEAVRT